MCLCALLASPEELNISHLSGLNITLMMFPDYEKITITLPSCIIHYV